MPRLLLPLVGCVLLVALGVGAIMYADYDDAPGLGLIGFVLIFGAIGSERAVFGTASPNRAGE